MVNSDSEMKKAEWFGRMSLPSQGNEPVVYMRVVPILGLSSVPANLSLDQNRPIIEDYEPPSPIKVGNNNSEDMGRSNEIPRVDNRSAVSNLTFIETLEELNQQPNISHIPKSVLEVIYTDVDMHHRFIRFTSKD